MGSTQTKDGTSIKLLKIRPAQAHDKASNTVQNKAISFHTKIKSEVVSDAISGKIVQFAGMNLCANIGDPKSFSGVFRTTIISDRKQIVVHTSHRPV